MEKHYQTLKSRSTLILSVVLLFALRAYSQNFQVVWGMNQTLAGASSSSNFVPTPAVLYGATPHPLPTVIYYSLGGGDYAYGTRYWQNTSVPKYLEFSFAVNTYEYDISSVSFRVRRSPVGPKDVSLRSSLDGFSSDVSMYHLTTDGVFYNVVVPFAHTNLSNGLTFRIYGKNADTYLGVMYFDQIVVSGKVNNFVLPVNLTSFDASVYEKQVHLDWETGWEHNSRAFKIERSADMVSFKEIGTVAAHIATEGKKHYAFVDEMPLRGVSYYRLKMLDQDENFTYSHIRDVVIYDDIPQELIVAPNPAARDQITILKNFAGSADLTLLDLRGVSIPIHVSYLQTNYLNILPFYPLSSGIYVLTLVQNGRKQHAKVLVP